MFCEAAARNSKANEADLGMISASQRNHDSRTVTKNGAPLVKSLGLAPNLSSARCLCGRNF